MSLISSNRSADVILKLYIFVLVRPHLDYVEQFLSPLMLESAVRRMRKLFTGWETDHYKNNKFALFGKAKEYKEIL